MKEITYPSTKDYWNGPKKPTSERIDPRLTMAMNERVSMLRETLGVITSRANIYSTCVLQQDDWVSKRYSELVRKDSNNGRKYLDGIKTPQHAVYRENFDN